MSKEHTSIGGQAVLEGVMMRSPHAFVVALRRSNQKIRLRKDEWFGFERKIGLFKKPFFRGILILLETMANGVVALNYSAQVSLDDETAKKEKEKELKRAKLGSEIETISQVGVHETFKEGTNTKKKLGVSFMTFVTILSSLCLGMGLFVLLPHALTAFLGKVISLPLDGLLFHFIDGLFKAFLFIAYVFLIGLFPDIQRVFEYHGAEHQAIACFESKRDFTVENARECSRYHPRCGTTFVFFLLFISIIFFAIFFALVPVGVGYPFFLSHLFAILLKILLSLPIAGFSYELIRLASKAGESKIAKALALPGLLLQRLTTRIPNDAQLEVAIASIKAVLLLEEKIKEENEKAEAEEKMKEEVNKKKKKVLSLEEIDIESLDDLKASSFKVYDFLA